MGEGYKREELIRGEIKYSIGFCFLENTFSILACCFQTLFHLSFCMTNQVS